MAKEKKLQKPPHLEDIDPNTSGAHSRQLQLVSRSTMIKERALEALFLACACVAVLAVLLIFAFTLYKALPVLSDIGLLSFFGMDWAPSSGHYGIMALLVGSIIVTAGALVIGVPLAIGCAVYLTEIANKRLSNIVSTAVDLLAGVPSVIYGFFGLVILRPWLADLTGGLGFGALTAWLVLAIMIVPTITTLTMDALRSIPMGVREASYSMGATKWQTIYKVVLPAAKLGIVNAVVLGMGRAIGETMAVLMVVGNAPVIPENISSPISTLTSQIALDMGYSSGLHRSALFGMGVVLFIISAGLVGIVRLISRPREAKVDTAKAVKERAEKDYRAKATDYELAEDVAKAPSNLPELEKEQEHSRQRIKRLLASGAKPKVSKNATNATMLSVFRATGAVTTGVLVLIILFVLVNGLPVMSLDFIFGWPQGVNAEGGIFPTIVSSLYVTVLAMLICTPIAVLAAVYLAEYAKQGRLVNFIRYATDTLASVPSIVMGLFGFALFVEAFGFGLSMLSAALALALMMLPIVMRTTEEAIRAVPRYIRWGAYGLGATKWQVVSRVVLPSAFPRIATGIVLAIGRAVGETAVVLYTMGQAINLPITPMDSGRPMTIHLYLLANDGINMQAAYGTALLLMLMILAFNLFARYLSRKSAKKTGGK
ncbi:phosphate ABC transporter permease subunit PstC [Muricaecibacterium torontonense]|jgi:phosphate transport system permease protein|uniref:phosphate ABC transporter permease subunit PstC n=1 Tax=Muricaecibacterium torontonense TaxID=3032871 RepID=UPI0023B85D53|nr:phosphate ABC transporter permease subunit PstC [Muricaecibacterium torontonense]